MNDTSTLLKFDDSKRAVANLMARENISVQIVDGAPTASFDVTRRVLTIPNWASLTVEQTDLLIAHEIGHALFTPQDTFEKIAKDSRSLFSYVNIIEDARIERKMKAAFPGLARTFYNGYHQFHQNGPILNGTRDALYDERTGKMRRIADMKLIDRINLYYKIGAFVAVPFASTERTWIERIDKAADIDQVVQIARELHKLAKEQNQQSQTPQTPQNPCEGEGDGEPQDGESQDQDQDQDQDQKNDRKSKSKSKPEQSEDQDESESENANDGDESGEGDDAEGDDSEGDSADGDDAADGDDGEDSDDAGDDDGDDDSEAEAKGESKSEAKPKKSKSEASTDTETSKDNGDDEAAKVDQGETDDESSVEPETATAADETLRKLAELAADCGGQVQVRHLLISPMDDKTFADRVVPAARWAELTMQAAHKNATSPVTGFDKLTAKWLEKYGSTAKHMALEFERRKTAKALAQIKSAKTGKLNLTKLSQYKFTEDLFLRATTVPNGKSHGVVMVIDASGSMQGCFANVMDQVLLFAHFAHQVQIPFEAYMFTDAASNGYSYNGRTGVQHKPGMHTIALSDEGRLIGLVNTKTGHQAFKQQVRAVLALRQVYARDVRLNAEESGITNEVPWASLGGTPLYTGIMLGEKALENMKRVNRLDKTTFMVVTDGGDTAGLLYQTSALDRYGKTYTDRNRVGDTAIVVRDTVTKKNFVQVAQRKGYDGKLYNTLPDNGVITMLLDVIAARHECRTMYLYLQSSGYGYSYRRSYRRRRSGQVTVDGLRQLTKAGQESLTENIEPEAVTDALKEKGQYVLPTEAGIAHLSIILKADTLGLTEDAFSKLDTTDMSQRKVAAEFTKTMVAAVTNRVFVNTVVPYLA
jgi:hypothetical protein